ncbi:hypothetical protein K504DRAFT_459629 [Pleomassaria siparia CBS 279.74]|uniref:Actin-like ATPase domain-containing protein n=1 Tax=Pleomassaria siparia CBS 279.74 TaxID=1314801 RepID=A0A6G1K152_9PLEO|nr:hypothetical protein K504DRAFT_459629 [Pleomassaria siparia CBS 279.74]
MAGNRLVIGLDYGTTYTGVAFCETSDAETDQKRIQIIQDWPSGHTMIGTKEKVPSELAYADDGQVLWGSLIPPHVKRHMWTKLELDKVACVAGESVKIQEELSPLNKDPVEVIVDYLSNVKDHLIRNLDKQYGPALWRTLPMTLVVTVPAIWSDAAKDRTLGAVRKAGFNDSYLPQLKRTLTTTEPEAAAIYTLKSMRGTAQDQQMAMDDGFIVCDMGGGTVDLISYRISDTDPLKVDEVTIGSGAQCGGSFVDLAFLAWLERRLGVEDFVKIAGCRAEECSRTCLSPKLRRMIQEFTFTAKSGFSGDQDYYLQLPHPLSAVDDWERGMIDGDLHVESGDMKEMFEFSLQETCQLITYQLKNAKQSGKVWMKYVFLVGGFAESPYMFNEIKKFLQRLELQAIKPAFAWSAIARGAAATGLEGDSNAIVKRKCRRHYGTIHCPFFIPGKYCKSQSWICPYKGTRHAGEQAAWLIKKGDDMYTSKKTHASKELSLTWWPSESKSTSFQLLACDMDTAPQLSQHATVYKVAQLTVDTNKLPINQVSQGVSSDGRLYYNADVTVEISMQSTLEFSVSFKGKKYAAITARYD